jgi:hypothetical protein
VINHINKIPKPENTRKNWKVKLKRPGKIQVTRNNKYMFIIIGIAKIIVSFCIGLNIGYHGMEYLQKEFSVNSKFSKE